jgi:hypothetical protein
MSSHFKGGRVGVFKILCNAEWFVSIDILLLLSLCSNFFLEIGDASRLSENMSTWFDGKRGYFFF